MASNYSLASGETASANITVRNLTVGVTGINKVYDGNAAAMVGYTDNRVLGDNLTFTGNASFADKTAANGKAVTTSGIAVSGSDSANYSANTVASTTANISKAALTVTAQAVSKTYDGTTSASGNGAAGALAGAGAGESINAAATQAFLDRNAGTANKAVRASGLTIKDAGNLDVTGNYVITYADNTASTISPAMLAVTANRASRLYGAANPALSGNVSGFVNTDTLANATTGTETFTSTASAASNVGNYSVTGAGLTANYGNYVFTQAAGNAGALSVTPATLTVTANDATRTYGAANPALSGTLSGFVNGESSASAGVSGAAALSTTASLASDVGNAVITTGAGTLAAGNYTFTHLVDGTLRITPAALTVTSSNASQFASAVPYSGGNGVTYSGFVNNQTAAALGGSLAYGGSSQGATTAGNYTITAGGQTAGNYSINYVNGVLTLIPTNLMAFNLGGSTLVEAYLSAQNSVDQSQQQDGSSKANNANVNGVNQPFIASDDQGRTSFTLINCGVSMPSGVSATSCL